MRILFFSHSVADWGGLQEWVTGLSSSLAARGNRVGLVTSSVEISQRAASAGVWVYDIDWSSPSTKFVLDAVGSDWDIVVTTPLIAREVGSKVASALQIPSVATFHGVYSDYVYAWKKQFAKMVVVAPALANMLKVVGGVEQSEIATIPNGVPESETSIAPLGFADKVEGGVFTIAMACRLEMDKLSSLDVLYTMIPKLSALGVNRVNLILLGDGKQRNVFVSRLRSLSAAWPMFTFELRGWLDTAAMFDVLRRSVVTLGAGRTALHSLAAGTPVIGVGARAFVGVSSIRRMPEMLDCNFGDYIPARPMESFEDLDLLTDAESYDAAAAAFQNIIREGYTETKSAECFEKLFRSLLTSERW